MTEQEAIINLKKLFSEYELDLPCTDSLKTLHLAISALEKQTSKKPICKKMQTQGNWRRILIRNNKGGCIGAKMLCPVCNADNGHDEYMRHCPNCGAKLEKYIENEEE